MAFLVWDKVGERFYTTGVDRGVLYYGEGAVPWNGLTSVEESPEREHRPFYLDGFKYMESAIPGDYSGRLKAFTYPDEFERFCGVAPHSEGVSIHDQNSRSFGLSYRTKVGNDVDGVDHGYQIHVLYNLTAIPDSTSHVTMNNAPSPLEFSWTLHGRPMTLLGFRPTAHISFDSRNLDSEQLSVVEEILYGSSETDAYLPLIVDLLTALEETP